MSWAVHVSTVDGMAELSSPPTPKERLDLARQAGVKRPRRCTSVTGPAAWAARTVLGNARVDPERLGIIACGGNFHAQHCLSFLDRALQGSPELVNPLDFPHTLVSALPTTIAEALQARGFAFTLGDDEFAVLDILATAADLMAVGAADCVIGVFCCAGDGIAGLAHEAGLLQARPGDCAIAVRISQDPHTGSTKIQPAPTGAKPDVVFDALSVAPNAGCGSPYHGPAAGAVLLHETSAGLGSGSVDIGIRNSRGCRSLRLG